MHPTGGWKRDMGLAECWSTNIHCLVAIGMTLGTNTLVDFASKNISHANISVEDFERMN